MKKEIENISKIILQCIEEDEGLKMIWNEDTLCFGIRTLKSHVCLCSGGQIKEVRREPNFRNI